MNGLIFGSLNSVFLVLGAFAVGVLLWFVTKKKKSFLWMPILRVLPVRKKLFFERIFKKPPFQILFYILLGLVFIFYSLQPKLEQTSHSQSSYEKVLFWVDRSESMGAHINDNDLEELLKRESQNFAESFFVDEEIFQYEQKSLREMIVSSPRPFVNDLNKVIENLSRFDLLVIVSDLDAYSWRGVNWKYLQKKIPVKLIDVSKAGVTNVYAKSGSQESLTLAKVGSIDNVKLVGANGKSISFKFLTPEQKISTAKLTPPIQIIANDDLKSDNMVTVPLNRRKETIHIAAPVFSENSLHDRAYYLSEMIRSLGFKVAIHENKFTAKELTVDLGGEICQPTKNGFWLIPIDDAWDRLCECMIKIVGSEFKGCSDVGSANGYVSILTSIGAKQVGGELGELDSAVAYEMDNKVFFSVDPTQKLSPSSYALFLRELFDVKGILQESIQFIPPIPFGESELVNTDRVQFLQLDEQNLQIKEASAGPVIFALVVAILVVLLLEVSYSWIFLLLLMMMPSILKADIDLVRLRAGETYPRLAKEVSLRTSIQMKPKAKQIGKLFHSPWLWVKKGENKFSTKKIKSWLQRGGFIVFEQVSPLGFHWKTIDIENELMRSFYLLNTLPDCGGVWKGHFEEGRLAALLIPYGFLNHVKNGGKCQVIREHEIRSFVNILMVALTLNYKRDQIHLPEILKRIR